VSAHGYERFSTGNAGTLENAVGETAKAEDLAPDHAAWFTGGQQGLFHLKRGLVRNENDKGRPVASGAEFAPHLVEHEVRFPGTRTAEDKGNTGLQAHGLTPAVSPW
jgi:hypothetical protein